MSNFAQHLRAQVRGARSFLGYRRRCRLYGVGIAKSGTHSVAALFEGGLRAAHEPDDEQLIRRVQALARGQFTHGQLVDYLRRRDRWLRLDVDASQLNAWFVEALRDAFDDAYFVLTVRDPYSWLDSLINDSLRRAPPRSWHWLREHRFGPRPVRWSRFERALEARGLFSLDGYLSHWTAHNRRVLEALPSHRLLVVKTADIGARALELAAALGLPPQAVEPSRAHAFSNPQKAHVLRLIDGAYLDARVQACCGPLMAQLFPDVRRAADAGLC